MLPEGEWGRVRLPHTTRAALTGLRRKGMRVDQMRNEDGISVYRIVSEMAG